MPQFMNEDIEEVLFTAEQIQHDNAPTDPLSPEQRAQMEAWLADHPYGDQDENGIDISLLRENLKITPLERLNRLQSALDSFHRMNHVRYTSETLPDTANAS